ncbi:ribosomal RNA small subunit methyltransferase A [Ruficoccus amylovorans]|uniref:Ribosomal RNA small subunit methyltransferase A n=1 Tax=Ruficoccus amylovorans TaxID=1804625 RepID=A0A842HJG6_9BACT|nr:16S rRNA (adenine(1518)-N(6)/adenine(1519)-N(6))-dimethyltransferase RsmA [Ruficoccus amylovorans]MBC2595301.1 ribosomal RNA small subunit methyltransferase A [Ruficoccus amylovorans]
MLTLTQTRERLQALGMHPSKKLGQNFLVDPNIVRKSLDLAKVTAGDTVVEVGPGLGTLTGGLLERGAEVYAVELDHRLAASLRETRGDEPRFHLAEADAMDKPLGDFPGDRPFKIVANLPYAISTPWMEKILAGPLPEKMVLMLQREAAERFTAEPGGKNIGAVSLFLAAAYVRRPGHAVARSCFYPAPDIDSVLLHLERREHPRSFAPQTRALMRKFFTQRRKQIGSLARQEKSPALDHWLAVLESAGLPPTLRPEALPLDAWLQLDQALQSA